MFENLRHLLSDYYMLYLKMQNYHWNLEGKDFLIWHQEFEKQYRDLADVIDITAELIRGLGYKAPANFETYTKYTSIKAGNENYNSEEMVSDIANDHDKLLITLEKVFHKSEEIQDQVIMDFVINRMSYHRKILWMLKSSQK
jgi:starvation-inducible DNA-binding protein